MPLKQRLEDPVPIKLSDEQKFTQFLRGLLPDRVLETLVKVKSTNGQALPNLTHLSLREDVCS